ncbi:MAG: site-2 protease family protein [Eggerthellaceae bacterium]|jgi:regulator of sigma E protease
MIIYATIVLGFLVFIHEGGHYLAARAFGVRVSEFMIGLPGPSIGFRRGETRFGVTCVPLGGYARVCGMEPGEMAPHLKEVFNYITSAGTAAIEDVASACAITEEEAEAALEELVEWGTIVAPLRHDEFNTYRVAAYQPTKRTCRKAEKQGKPLPQAHELGAPHEGINLEEFFDAEYHRQYRSLSFWKRSVILLAGIAMNLVFAILAFVLIYSVIGVDVQDNATGAVQHLVVDPLRSIQAGFICIGMVIQAVVDLFNPATAGETISNSASIVGIAVLSKSAAEAGFVNFLFFTAMISVSLGIFNLVPIPPLDGGRFLVEIIQKLSKRLVSIRVMNYISFAGIALFMGFFIIMLNQDIQRFVFGIWS